MSEVMENEAGKGDSQAETSRSSNVVWQTGQVPREQRFAVMGQQGATLWFTGLSGAGKSALAFTLDYLLNQAGYKTYVLDGDNIRHGLNSNLGFSAADREENIRRVGEVSRLFADAGVLVLSSFISPFRRDRELVRHLHEQAGLRFIEIFMDTPLEICEERDPKKLYEKARRGEIKDFTGIHSPYETPQGPELAIQPDRSPEDAAHFVLDYLRAQGLIR